MPELPEVFTIVSDLNKHIVGYKIDKCVIDDNYKKAFPNKEELAKRVTNKTIVEVERIAKNILIHLDDNSIIHIHLAMTGQVLLKEEYVNKWLKVLFNISKDAESKMLMFNDMRMFGKVALINNNDKNELIKKYGPEPIDKNITADDFYKSIKSKRTNIKNALLDQKVVSGLGNIYATDTLFLAKVHPLTNTQDISKDQAQKLFTSARDVLLEGIKNRGSTLEDKKYVDIFENHGNHQNYFKIYSKKECPDCNKQVDFKKINGRGTYFCSNCQK